jgi:prefoldin subunit 5
MQKTKTKLITALLLATLTLAIYPFAANASTGFILINKTTAPSLATSVPAGGNVNLYFGSVTFSGGQSYLLLSTDGFSQVSGTDIRFTPSLSLAAIQGAAVTVVTDPTGTFPGTWNVGFGWINGTIPTLIAGGPYFVKAFDGATTSVAVTDIPLTVTASLTVAPTSGAAGTSLTLLGNAFPSGSLVNVTYINAFTLPNPTEVTVSNLTATGSIGNFTLTLPAPDLKQAAAIGDNAAASNSVTFTAQENLTLALYQATYSEHQRGLLQIGRPATTAIAGNVMNATGIYGNLTSFGLTPTVPGTTISVGVGDILRIVGNWFYPGAMSIKLDNSIDITPSGLAANGTGYFNTTVTVPGTGLGAHNVTILDNGLVVFAVFLNVVPAITISPSSGPIGTVVTVNGFGFPSAVTGTAYNATITFDATAKGWALTDGTGAFTTTITVPTTTGGGHTITATTNDTGVTTASKTFTVTASFTVSPVSFYANDSSRMVTASGTGFDPSKTYFVAIDNLFTPFTNTTNGLAASAAGNLSISFIGVGFQAGLHIVILYQAGLGTGGTYAPAANATFTVLADPLTSTSSLLTAINDTVTQTNNTLTGIGANITSIKGTVATIQTATGTIQTTLAALNATLIAINGNTATLSTSIGTITTSINALSGLSGQISGISGSITSISNGLATVQTSVGTITTKLDNLDTVLGAVAGQNAEIQTSLGTITTSLDSIGAKVTSITGDTATIKTDLGTITGTVTSISGDTATIKTNLGTMQASIGNLGTTLGSVQSTLGTVQTDVSSTKSTTNGLSPLIIVAIVLALIAAIAAIASIVLMRRKIAG